MKPIKPIREFIRLTFKRDIRGGFVETNCRKHSQMLDIRTAKCVTNAINRN